MTSAERYERAQQVFHDALQRPSADRTAFVRAACAGDPDLAGDVLSLLAAHEAAGAFLEPAMAGLAVREPAVLPSGTRLGPYEVVSHLASGGMGDVYVGRDARLGRLVAIKLLSAARWMSPEARARFEREGRAIASLSHPHICAVFDVGALPAERDDAQVSPYLVMELLDGETLASRLERGPLSIDEALEYAGQMLQALRHAHGAGLVHRDLKPQNVFLTPRGVKLLDFGLARSSARPPHPVSPAASTPLTAPHMLVGTPAYMAPEQIEGRAVDARTDLFTFGVLLYEAIGGRRPFTGDTVARTIAAVLERTPPALDTLRPQVPPLVARVLERCLEKSPDRRWQTAEDLERELQWAARAPAPSSASGSTRRVARAATALAALALGFAIGQLWWWRDPAPRPVPVSASVVLPAGLQLAGPNPIAVAPDGRRFACALAAADGAARLYLRTLDVDAMQPLPGTDGAGEPFWSPDGTSVGFFAGTRLLRLDLATLGVSVLAENASGGGATWSPGGTIVFASRFGESALWRVAATGGTVTPLTRLGPRETNHLWPRFLPDGDKLIFHLLGRDAADPTGIYVTDLAGAAPRLLVSGQARAEGRNRPDLPLRAYYADGYLVVLRGTEAFAQPLDPGHLALTGEPRLLVERVSRHIVGPAEFDVAGSLLVYGQQPMSALKEIVWVDRNGRYGPAIGSPDSYIDLALSPDARKLVVQHADDISRTLRTIDLDLGTWTALGTNRDDMGPVWSPDGHRLAYGSARRGPPALFEREVDDPASERRLTPPGRVTIPTDWSADGRVILMDVADGASDAWDIWAIDPREPATARPLVQTSFSEHGARLSPDGRWMAYVSDASGKPDVYVARFRPPGTPVRISRDGGTRPRWRGDGAELFFVSGDGTLMSASVGSGSTPVAREPAPLFPLPDGNTVFEVAPDGTRMLVTRTARAAVSPPLAFVRDWQAALGR